MDLSQLSRGGRGGLQKELNLLLERVGHRVHGELLLDGHFAVNKMKSELLHAGEESSSGSVKLVQALKKPAAEWEHRGSQQKLIESYMQWLDEMQKLDDNYRFISADVETAPPPFSGYVRPLHPLASLHPLHPFHSSPSAPSAPSALCTLCTLCPKPGPHSAHALMPRAARFFR